MHVYETLYLVQHQLLKKVLSKILGSTIEATSEISPGECIIGTWLIILIGLLSRIAASLENPKSSSIFKVFKIYVA